MLTEKGPSEAVYRLNELMQEAGMLDRFITLAVGLLDPALHQVTFINAGHLLGSAYARLHIGGKTILFGGDLGRYGRPVLPDPSPVSGAELGQDITSNLKWFEHEPWFPDAHAAFVGFVNEQTDEDATAGVKRR